GSRRAGAARNRMGKSSGRRGGHGIPDHTRAGGRTQGSGTRPDEAGKKTSPGRGRGAPWAAAGTRGAELGLDVDAVVAAKSQVIGEPPRGQVCGILLELGSNWRAKGSELTN